MAKEKQKDKDISQMQKIDLVVAAVDKEFGKGSLVSLDNIKAVANNSISTGSIMLDDITGIGGIPKGRITEIFGPESSGKSTLALSIVAQVNKLGKYAAYIDVEHAIDISYAKKIGVIPDLVRFSQPPNGESALNITQACIESKAFDIIVIDSVAALAPQKEIDGEIGDAFVGLQSRLMSQAMRVMSPIIKSSDCAVIFINQIRMKIGVMYGCFHYDTLVNFADGRSLPIGYVVDNKINGEVYCLNLETDEIEKKPIVKWHDNGKINLKDDFIHIETNSIGSKGGKFGFTCTPNHEILTKNGWKQAKYLSYNDELISKYTQTINGTYFNFMLGCIIGDSCISIRSNNTACIKFQDNKNKDYVNWKLNKLSPFLLFKECICNKKLRYISNYTYELSQIKKSIGDRDPMFMLNNYSDLSMALWIMDDGHYDDSNKHNRYVLSVKRFKNNVNKLQEIKSKLNSLGLECSYDSNNGNISFTSDSTKIIASNICKYVPQFMQYKLPKEFQNKYEEFTLSNNPKICTDHVKIIKIRHASDKQLRNKRKFDLTIEGNSNYFVGGISNGVIVHNSPETSPGGMALKFYSDLRIDIRRAKQIVEGEKQVGQIVRAKIVKNKLAAPFKVCEFPIIYEDGGISTTDEVIDIAIGRGILTKSGAWLKHTETGKLIGPGKPKARKALKEDVNFFEIIKNQCIESIKLEKIQPTEETDSSEEEIISND